MLFNVVKISLKVGMAIALQRNYVVCRCNYGRKYGPYS